MAAHLDSMITSLVQQQTCKLSSAMSKKLAKVLKEMQESLMIRRRICKRSRTYCSKMRLKLSTANQYNTIKKQAVPDFATSTKKIVSQARCTKPDQDMKIYASTRTLIISLSHQIILSRSKIYPVKLGSLLKFNKRSDHRSSALII